MIRPLPTSKFLWVLDWVDLEEPVRHGEGYMLPTCLFVMAEGADPVIGHEIMPELDQRRAENLLARLFSDRGTPDEVVVPDAEEWDERAWDTFSRETGCAIRLLAEDGPDPPRLLQTTRRIKSQMAQRLAEPLRAAAPEPPERVAAALVEMAARVESRDKRHAMLQKARQLDPGQSAALLELAEMDFQDGRLKDALSGYGKVVALDGPRWRKTRPQWWADRATRPYLRALYGQMLVQWHLGRLPEAISPARKCLELNPEDNQGIRFLLPMLYLLTDQPERAMEFFRHYETEYRGDYDEPSLLFGWGYTLVRMGEEAEAAGRYLRAIARNLYIAPVLLDLPEPRHDLWHPNDRSEPGYAFEFCDSYAILWERDAAALRILREVWERNRGFVEKLVALRAQMADFQDQRYDPEHDARWKAMLDEEKEILREAGVE